MAAVAEIGRLPEADELQQAVHVIARFGRSSGRSPSCEESPARSGKSSAADGVRICSSTSRRHASVGGRRSGSCRQRSSETCAYFGTSTKAYRAADDLLFRASDPATIDG